MLGYLFLGAAFGILLNSKGYGWGWAVLMSVFIYAGSMQFVAIGLLSGPFLPLQAALMTLMVNARHTFYGISMLEKFKSMGRKKPYMVFSLTDETFSLLCSARAPEGVDENRFRLWVSFLDQIYWIVGSAAGGLIGSLVSFNTKGIDFVMTALFTVIFLEQWENNRNHIPALVGLGGSVLCLAEFGPGNFILPSMVLIVAILSLFRKASEKEETV
ncbi:AzlC family ABC transporter permease [Caproiciproducens faecalis]|uniref:AzlC family ABC transporter permease n=1 Tax=Caproiciproducens faecalis TaxID=2820301 RepID=A0ABS7DLE2_9FIRM|nr:AzlC family ABC transporter permease [Caproiciproducens faecalis]MBW7571655.1 AzlC family ABC transporter permease [Caproiciproducens faecalis]